MNSNEYLQTTIDLLRHGECKDGHCYRGTTDVPLTVDGFKQMESGVEKLEPCWHRVIASPLVRCSEFAEKISSQYNLPLNLSSDLQEMHFGEWEGRPVQAIWDTQKESVKAWGLDPVNNPPPGGEPADIFAGRVQLAFTELIEQYAGQHLLLISHGGVMRVLLAYCLSVSLSELHRFDIPYACVSRIKVTTGIHTKEKYFQLLTHNIGGK